MKKISFLLFVLCTIMWSGNISAQNAITFWKNGTSSVIDNPDSISFKDPFNPQNNWNAATYWKDGQATVVNAPDSILFWIYDLVYSGFQDLEEAAAPTETELFMKQLISDEETAPITVYSEEDSLKYDALALDVLKMYAKYEQEEAYDMPQKKLKLSDDELAQEVIRDNGNNILRGFTIEQQDWHTSNWGNTRYGGFETYYNTTIENSKRYLILVFYREGGFPNKKTAYIKVGQLNSGPIAGSVIIYPGRDYAFIKICLDDYLKGYGCVNFFPLLITEGSGARNYLNPIMVKHDPIVSPNWDKSDNSFEYEFGTINGVSVYHNGYSYNKAGRLLTNISGGHYQCVELCKRYVKTLNKQIKRPLDAAGWDGLRWGNAIDWPDARRYDKVDKDAYYVFANDGKTRVREGDLIVWQYKSNGHIGVVIKTTENTISIAHQNGGNGKAALPIGTKMKIENGVVKDIAPGSTKSPIFGNGVNPIPYFIRINNKNEYFSSFDKTMEVSTTNIAFKKEVEIGGNGAAMPFTITNTGLYKSLDISSIEMSRGDGFTTNATPCSIGSGESRTFYVTFNPTRPEKYEGRIVIKSNADDNPIWVIKLSGKGKGDALVGIINVVPKNIDFGTVKKGVPDSKPFAVQNTGAYDLKFRVDQATAPFRIPEAGQVITVPAGKYHTMEVICDGLEPGEVVENVFVKISSDATNKDEVTGIILSANGGLSPLQLSTTTFSLITGNQGSVEITSGSGSYSIESIIPSGIVTASIVDNKSVAIEANTPGTAVITVKDNLTGQTATITVTVTGQTDTRELMFTKNVGSTVYSMYKKTLSDNDYHINPDGWKCYRSELSLDITKNGNTNTYVVDNNIYLDKKYDHHGGQQPCMLLDFNKNMMYIFCNSKDDGPYYSMDGNFYSSSMNNIHFSKETVFEGANWGWYPYFCDYGDDNIYLCNFSYAGYFTIMAVREGNTWELYYYNTDISPEQATREWEIAGPVLVIGNPEEEIDEPIPS